MNGSIQELLERSPFLEGLDRRDLVELPQPGMGEGFRMRRAFAGVDLRALDPFVHMDQVGEVNYAPGEPKDTPAPPPGLRDRHLHDRRHSPPPGLQWRWRADHRRRHPMDDRRSWSDSD
jgi:hypothetical protein